jgi:hypothetical protein
MIRFQHAYGGFPHGPHGHPGFRYGPHVGGGRPYPAYVGGYRHPGYAYGGYGGGFAGYGRPAPYGVRLGCSVSQRVGITPWGWHKSVTTKVCYAP